jgi:hypothetical protein
MSSTFVCPGLDQLIAELRDLPADLAGEGAHIIEARANAATHTIASGYPSRAGDLRKSMTVEHTSSRFGARSVIRNTSKHALPFEHGSQARHTALGANRGVMPPNHLFSRTVAEARRGMWNDFAVFLVRKGLLVTADV